MNHLIQLVGHDEGFRNKVLLFMVFLFNGVYMFSKDDISWGLGVITAILAIVNYVLQIRKNAKNVGKDK